MSDLETLKSALGDKYLVDRELGRGGMATVYLARDRKLDREVAIKVLLPDLAAALGAERFRREIEIVTRLSHPHVLPLYDWGDAGGHLYYVMPFVRGESLRARLDREHQLAIEEAVRIVCEIAVALEYAHGQGILHRDIKPENILLEQGQAIIADFGIARVIGEASAGPALTQTGMAVGTPTYMSPEQALGEKKIDGRADQYSLACVLYEALAGHPPFTGGSLQALIMRHTVEQVPPLHIVRRTVAPELEAVIMRALAKSPADRFANCAQFAEALLSPAGFTSQYHVSLTRGIATVADPRARRRRIIVGAAAAGLVLAAAGAWKFAAGGPQADIRQMGAEARGLEPRRVAVPYFRDVSATQQLAEVAGGLTEGLIEQLSQVQELDVISKSGVSRYRADTAVSRDSLVRAFKAAWLVEGSVDRDGPDVRVTVKLIDGASGGDVETASFKQPPGKTLALRDSLLRQVSYLLQQKIGGNLRSSAKRREANNDDAWLLVQQAARLRRDGEAAFGQRNEPAALAAFAQSDTLLAKAESLDPDWPEPTIQRSFAAYRRGRVSTVPNEKLARYNEALTHADRIIAKDPQSPQMSAAYEARGTARLYQYLEHLITDQREADAAYATSTKDLEEATKLARTNANAWVTLSFAYMQKPDFASSKLAATNAYASDPFMLRAAEILDRLYVTSYITETFNDADKYCADGRSRFPKDHRFLRCWLWLYTVAEVRPTPSVDTAWMLADSIPKLAPPARREFFRREAQVIAGIVLGRLGQVDSAKRVLDRVMDTPKDVDPPGDLLYYNAYARLTLGDKRTAIDLLKIYLTRNPEHRAGWGKDSAWWWKELKQDPEFQRLIATGT